MLVSSKPRLVSGFSGRGQGKPSGGNGASATAFWTLYNEHAKPAGVAMTKAKALAGNGNWEEAIDALRALIDEAQE